MSHPFGNLLSQHLHREHGLSQSKLAAGILQDPAIIAKMCKGQRLTGLQARERVVAIVDWLRAQGTLATLPEANALLAAAGMSPLRADEPAERALQEQLNPQPHLGLPPAVAPVRKTNLPAPLTSFVGRQRELAEITQHITTQRLVTLIGAGGMGKTRMAIEVARRLVDRDDSHQRTFPDGVWFVALEAVDAPERMASTIADALQCPPPGAADVRDHLLSYLQTRQLLLVLDNFEHLRDGADLLTAIMMAAPQAKLLVTSRAALNLEQEWRYPLNGLPLELGDDTGEAVPSSAAHLFVERARRVSPAFDLTAERAAVERICRLVEGIPLAIELAATWSKLLSCKVIADEIASNVAFLTSDMRNVPDRHRSMQAVFDHSWALLSQEERQVFARLSVFQGGFARPAAATVAGASLSLLSALIDKSLLHADETGRFSIHELLRQYAQERLERDAEAALHARDAHSAYFAGFLAQREAAIAGSGQRSALQEVAAELDNIRAAWVWATERLHGDLLRQAVSTLSVYCDIQGRYQEGVDLCEQAIGRLLGAEGGSEQGAALAVLLAAVGWLYIRLGRYEQAHQTFTRSRFFYSKSGSTPPPGHAGEPVLGLALLADVMGDYADAVDLARQAQDAAIARGDIYNQSVACYVQASTAHAQGEYAAAHRQAEQAYALAVAIDSRWMMAYILIILGNVASACGDYREAQKSFAHSHALQSELGNPEGMAIAQLSLAGLAAMERNYQDAEQLFQDSYGLYREINDPGGQVRALMGLGDVFQAQGDLVQACGYFCAGLELAIAIRSVPLLLLQFTPIGELLASAGEPALAAAAWTLVIEHAASERAMQQRARKNLNCTVARRPAPPIEGQDAAQDDPFAMASVLCDKLAQTKQEPGRHAVVATRLPTTAASPLIEPLTERELEILCLLAAGMTNQQIADRLIVVVGTVKAHNHHIFGKLGVSSRVQALARARELNLLA